MPKSDRLSEGGIKLLQEPLLAHFATVLPDNSPQVTPVWVDVEADGSHVLVNTAAGRLKINNVGQNPEVALSVVDKQNDFRFVIVRGTVVEQRSEGAREHINFLSKKYVGQDVYTFGPPDEQRVIIRIKPHHVIEQGV